MVISMLLNKILRINQLKALCPSTKSSCVHLLCINRSGEKRKQTYYLCVLHQSNSQLALYCVVSVTFWKRNWQKKTEWDERNPEPWINGNVAWYISGIKKEKGMGKPETFPQKEKKIVVETWQMSSNFWSAVKRKRESIELFIVTVEARIRINVRHQMTWRPAHCKMLVRVTFIWVRNHLPWELNSAGVLTLIIWQSSRRYKAVSSYCSNALAHFNMYIHIKWMFPWYKF